MIRMIRAMKVSGWALLAVALCVTLAGAQSSADHKAPMNAPAKMDDSKAKSDPHPATTAAAGWYGSAWFSGSSPSQDSSSTKTGWYGSAWQTTTVSPETAGSLKKAGWYGSAWAAGAWQPEGGATDKAGWLGSSYYDVWPGSAWYGTK
jgi:hypothetical protein